MTSPERRAIAKRLVALHLAEKKKLRERWHDMPRLGPATSAGRIDGIDAAIKAVTYALPARSRARERWLMVLESEYERQGRQ